MASRDFLTDDDGQMVIRNGRFVTGPSLTQEVALLMLTCQGEVRRDPLAGCNLLRMTNSRLTRVRLEHIVRVQIQRDGKRWEDVVGGLKLRTDV